MRWLASDFDHRFRDRPEHRGSKSSIAFIDEVQDAIGSGDPHAVPGEWPPSIRQLFQSTEFHFHGRRIYKRVDSITDAQDGNAGRDVCDMDDAALAKWAKSRPEAVQWLKDHAEQLTALEASKHDALNHADYGLIDVGISPDGIQTIGEETEDEEDSYSLEPQDSDSDDSESSDYEEYEDSEDEAEDFGLDDSTIAEAMRKVTTHGVGGQLCVMGFIPPKDRYEFVAYERPMGASWADAADERKVHFADLKAELEDCSTEEQINFLLWRIREDYYNDRDLRSNWNAKAFQEDRAIAMDSMIRQGLDQETIRRKLWAWFDRVESHVPAIFVNGKLKSQARHYTNSIWRQARSQALSELVLTTAQWTEVYKIAREKRKYFREVMSKEHLAAAEKQIALTKTRSELVKLSSEWLGQQSDLLNGEQRRALWKTFNKQLGELP